MFMKMYNQLMEIFKLPKINESNTAMFEGIQNLGQGLLQMAQIIAITKQHAAEEQMPEQAEENENEEE